MLLSNNWVFVSKETPFDKKGYLLFASNLFFVGEYESHRTVVFISFA